MAGSGWDAAGIDASITISGDGQTASRTGGNNDTFCVRGSAGRSKGRRYFEITPGVGSWESYVGAGFMDENASLGPHTLGSGSPIQGGWRAASGAFTYSYASGSGSREDGPNESEGVLGVLIDFDAKTCEIYKDGVLKFTEVMDIPNDTALFPACGLYDHDTEATLQTVEPFQFPPEETFIAWDKSDADLGSRVAGTLTIEGAPVSRKVKAFSFDRETYAINGETIQESRPLGQTKSNETTGDYKIILRGGFRREVFVVAFDDYGEVFEPDAAVVVGDRIHPTTPNGYVYDCTGSGTLSSEEPVWSQDTENDQLIGTASFRPTHFYRPMVHGPVVPEFIFYDPDDLYVNGEQGAWFNPSDLSTLFQDAAGTISVTADGDPVGLMLDNSPNENHVSQSVSASRPIYRTDGILHWLEFDGVDDFLESDSLPAPLMDGGGLIAAAWLSTVDEAIAGVVEEVWADGDSLNADQRIPLYADTRTSPMRFMVYAPDATVRNFNLLSKNSPNTGYVSVGNSDGVNISGRLNSVDQGSVPSSATFSETPTKIVLGKQTRGGIFLSGNIYSAVLVSEGQDGSVVSQIEDYLEQRTPA